MMICSFSLGMEADSAELVPRTTDGMIFEKKKVHISAVSDVKSLFGLNLRKGCPAKRGK